MGSCMALETGLTVFFCFRIPSLVANVFV